VPVETSSEGPATPAGSCPFVPVRTMAEVTHLMRSKTAVEQRPELFAASAQDPVNGAINVREFLDGSIMFANGDSHRERRKILNRLVRPDSLVAIREEIMLPQADLLMAERLEVPGANGQHGMDLIEFCERVFLYFTAKLIGLVGVDTNEGMTALRSCARGLAAGSSSGFLQDRSAINEMALEAKRRYVEEFYRPSHAAYEEMLAKVKTGELDDSDVPESLLKFVVSGAHPAWADEQKAIVESSILFAASVGTSTQSIVHTIDFLQGWFREHPEDWDKRTDLGFLLRALEETIRLRAPFSPYTCRMAAEHHTLTTGEVEPGQELHIEWVAANRDPAIFGSDANEYNPWRPDPTNGFPRYGVGFGLGPHQCFGLRVVVGVDGSGGAHVRLLQKLMMAGVLPDPSDSPTALNKDMDKFSIEDIPRYLSYPAIFAEWQPRPASGVGASGTRT
jgi:cytochrome P450